MRSKKRKENFNAAILTNIGLKLSLTTAYKDMFELNVKNLLSS